MLYHTSFSALCVLLFPFHWRGQLRDAYNLINHYQSTLALLHVALSSQDRDQYFLFTLECFGLAILPWTRDLQHVSFTLVCSLGGRGGQAAVELFSSFGVCSL